MFYKAENSTIPKAEAVSDIEAKIVDFCKIPRSRAEIANYLGLGSQSYVITKYVTPLVNKGLIKLTLPNKPRSSKQQYYSE